MTNKQVKHESIKKILKVIEDNKGTKLNITTLSKLTGISRVTIYARLNDIKLLNKDFEFEIISNELFKKTIEKELYKRGEEKKMYQWVSETSTEKLTNILNEINN